MDVAIVSTDSDILEEKFILAERMWNHNIRVIVYLFFNY